MILTNVLEGLRNIADHKLRSALTMLGVIIGVAAVITSVAVGEGAQQRISEQLRTLGSNLLLVTPGTRKREGVVLRSGSRLSITARDAVSLMAESPLIVAAGAYVSGTARLVAGNQNWSSLIAGVTPDYLKAREWLVARGQTLSPGHEEKSDKVVLLGQTIVRKLFANREPIGEVVRIRNVPFLVIGILEQKGQSAEGRDQDNIVMMPLSTARSRVLGRSRVKPSAVHGILVKVAEADSLDRAAMDIRRRLRIRHRLWTDERDDFRVRDLTQVAKARRESIQQFTLLVGIIASVSLLVGGIGIMNTLMVSVSERVREIGIRLAVGAEPRDIRRQFLTESLILSVMGGLVGVGAGAVAATVISQLTGWATHVSPYAVILAIGVSLVVGVGFGLYPAMKAAGMEPARSLRAE